MNIYYEKSLNYEFLRQQLLTVLESHADATDEEIHEIINDIILENAGTYSTIRELKGLSGDLFSSVRKLDILQELIDDPTVTEIMINGPDKIFIERSGVLSRWNKSFSSLEKLDDIVQRIAGRCNRVINERMPIVDARLADGSRVNAVIAPAALNGPILTIRRFPEVPICMDDLIAINSITYEAAEYLRCLVEADYSIIISGGTSSGKTTFLNVLSNYIPKNERVITIEDNAELQIQGIDNLVSLEAKMANMEGNTQITMRDLIRSALRMRPDRIIVGEVRGGEAVDLLQALNTGHDGSLSTIHSNSASDCTSRLETMVMLDTSLELAAIRRQIASGVDIIVHLGRLPDNSRHVLEISEVTGLYGNEITLNHIFEWDNLCRCLKKTGTLMRKQKLQMNGITLNDSLKISEETL